MNPNDSVLGMTAVVTGGSRGIGAEIAREIGRHGAKVAILGRDQGAVNEVCAEITGGGGQCEGVICDLASFEDVQRAAKEIEGRLGAADVLVNCAGVGLMGKKLLDCTGEEWERVMNTNLRGVFYAVKAFAPGMVEKGGGHIVNISSIASKNPLPGGAIYAASKWGLNGLSYSLAEELRENNVRVSLVCPGSVNTEFSEHAGRDLSRMLIPADVAHAVMMLLTQRPQSFVSELILRPTQKP